MSGKPRAPSRPHTFARTGWADAPQVGAPSGVLAPAALQFSVRTDVRRARPASSGIPWAWIALAVIALAGFGLVVNAMLERSSDTAGRSEAANAAPATVSEGAYDESQATLEEVWAMAVRGQMGLHQADTCLQYAHLHLARGRRDLALHSLAEARHKIFTMGYRRREGELRVLISQLES